MEEVYIDARLKKGIRKTVGERSQVGFINIGGSDMNYDVIVVGAGIAGLVAASELIKAKKKVLLLDQEPESSMGGQA